MPIEVSARIYATNMLNAGIESRQKFLRTTPPLTLIWENETKQVYGKTIGGQRIYINPNDDFVAVSDIQGDKKVLGIWSVKSTIPLTQQESSNSNITRR